ncbi:MoaD/ThiS family protein [Saxibacter everestensis]|uniref:Molybdopterin synthase sulfur carrier subunit n=1 Tax=Saxibacter everestensis TaxID=2909229 RepID=A0ABY8QWG3_9MICO|nr:MoaD/ThiS family protein [Brevibacteriaceae bacterium ZFBP1038]
MTSAVTVRYFAAARAAVLRDEEALELPVSLTLTELLEVLSARHKTLRPVLPACSYLVNGRSVSASAVSSGQTPMIGSGDTVDVLPPFAGG